MCVHASFRRLYTLLPTIGILPVAAQCMQLLIEPYGSDIRSMSDLQ